MAALEDDPQQLQNAFSARLTRYVNGGHLAAGDPLLSLLSMRLSRWRHPRRLAGEFELLRRSLVAAESAAPRVLTLEPYTGNEPRVRELQGRLAPLRPYLRAALLHGSLGNGDAVDYSDFDALIVLRDELFSSPRRLAATATRLSAARRPMIAFDPLQHHGWLVLTETDLAHYPESLLPLAALGRSKSLLGAAAELAFRVRSSTAEARESLARLVAGVLAQCAPARQPRDLYQLKSFLSRFMLLPAIYLHVRTGVGTEKGASFAAARDDFPASVWQAMARASDLRHTWQQPLVALRRAALGASLVARPFLLRRLAPPIPRPLERQLDANFYQSVAALAGLIGERGRAVAHDERLAP